MASDGARAALQRLIEERGEDYSGLSRLLGRNAAYVQQYIKRGTPRRLSEQDRKRLARYFDVDEALLGGNDAAGANEATRLVSVPLLDVGASAGAGAAVDGEGMRAHVAFDPVWLRKVASGGAEGLSIIRVEGDSMLPTLASGDEILVDRYDGQQRLRDGIYVLRLQGALMVKRLAFNPANRSVTISSDNGAYQTWPDCDPNDVELVGRAVWVGRRLT
jgi:phage repressor protein C with HTH and peptisase S24 domain